MKLSSNWDKQQLLVALTEHLKAKLAAQRQQAEDLLAQASESNREFFLKLQQTRGQDLARQLEALKAYTSNLPFHCPLVAPCALVHLSNKHMRLRVPAGSTPQQAYQSLRKQTLARRFESLAPELAYWWLLPEVVAQTDMGTIEFEYQGYAIQLVSGEVFGYQQHTILGLRAGDKLWGVDYAGYYDERGNSTYPDIDLYQLQILKIL